MNQKYMRQLFFVMGLGSQLQIVGSLSITELILFLSAPIIYLQDRETLRRDGFGPPLLLCLILYVGCALSCVANRSSIPAVMRGFASISVIPACLIFFHRYLRRDLNAFKWYFVGNCFSAVLCTFVFQKAVEVNTYGANGADDIEGIMSGPLFWISRLSPAIMAPIMGWYLKTPFLYSCAVPFAFAVFAALISASGRSAAISMFAYGVLILVGGRSVKSLQRLSRTFWLLAILAVGGVFVLHTAYKIAATSGWLGDQARAKYEHQSGGSGGIWQLLMGGRIDSFTGYYAAADRPIIGFGPWAVDRYGYNDEFLMKYGNYEDYVAMVNHRMWLARQGFTSKDHLIACHSSVTMFWLWYGIAGLVFWPCVIFWMFRYLRQDVAAIPQWFPWLGASIPGTLWAVFFSPFGFRTTAGFMLAGVFMARAVRRGLVQLPFTMQSEIKR